MKRRSLLLGALVAATGLSSCCAIVNGRTQNVVFDSTPSGARLYIDNVDRGMTPQKIALKRNKKYEVRVVAEGYEPYACTLESGMSGWIWGNLVFGGLIGLAIDVGTGSIWAFDDVDATLNPSSSAPVIRLTSHVPENAVKVGQMAPKTN